ATDPEGLAHVHAFQVSMVLHNLVLQQITYLADSELISIRGGTLISAGSAETGSGSFFRISGRGVSAETLDDRLRVTIGARILQDLPAGTRFVLSVTDDAGRSASVVRPISTASTPAPPPPGGFSVGDLVLAIAAALFAGGVVG